MPDARRGEIWLIDLGMVQKARPCLILSIAYLDHERAVVTYIPRTTRARGTRFEVSHEARGFDPGVFDAQGIGGVPVVKLERRLGVVESTILQQVEEAVKRWLNLP
jgi:mRNA-degrading endonuclease toxin of MazEF toxin-antitoxin module